MPDKRVNKIQIMLGDDELSALDDWRFDAKMPSRSAAVRGLLRIGLKLDLTAADFAVDPSRVGSHDIGVVGDSDVEPVSLANAAAALPANNETIEIAKRLAELRNCSLSDAVLEACKMALNAWQAEPDAQSGTSEW